MKSVSLKFSTVAILIALAALSRVLPHPFNFTPIGAMALFGAAQFDRKIFSFIIPLAAMLLSDFIIGFHGGMLVVYGSFALITLFGIYFLRKVTFGRIVVSSVVASVLFYTVTNFFVWYGGTMYPQTSQGLLACYVAGLAFYQHDLFGSALFNTVMGDLFFSGVLFGVYAAVQRFVPTLRFA
jgi:hypothetical protein